MAEGLTYASGNATGLPAGTIVATEKIDAGFGAQDNQRVKLGLGAQGAFDGDLEGNAHRTVLASGAHTTAQTSGAMSSPSGRGALFFLNVTVNAGATKTLSLKLQTKDPVSGTWVDWADFGVLVTNATGTFLALIKDQLTTGDLNASVIANKRLPLPGDWRAVVTPSDATSWTYSLGALLLI